MSADPMKLAVIMRDAGADWKAISRATEISVDTLRRRLDPDYREKRSAKEKARRSVFYGLAHSIDPNRPKPHEVLRALTSIPRDTRNLTARLCGDPLPGRSALDRRQVQ